MNEIYLLQDFQTTIFPFYLYVKTRLGRESGRLMTVTMTNTVMTESLEQTETLEVYTSFI